MSGRTTTEPGGTDMGLHRNRAFWHCSRTARNHRPDALWERHERFTSMCGTCGTTWWSHPTPRITCPDCGAWCVVTDEIVEETP